MIDSVSKAKLKVPARRRSATLRCYFRRSRRFLAQGLTVLGKPRKRPFKKYFTRAAKRMAANEQQRRWHNKRTAENRARGLTERGTVPVNRVFPELRGKGLSKREYSRRTYHLLKGPGRRAALASLLAGKNLLAKLK